MDSPRPAPPRLRLAATALILAAAGFAAPCAAQADRDGSPQSDAGYHGPYLSWAGKTAPSTPAPQPDPPAPPTVAAPSPPPAPVAAETLPPPAPPPTPARYSADGRPPPPAPVAAAAPPASPPPVEVAQAAPPPAAASPEGASAPVGPRFYSLHREYGLTPDPDPVPTNRPMVLIGPPDNPPAQSADGGAADGGASGAGASDGDDGDAATPHHADTPGAN